MEVIIKRMEVGTNFRSAMLKYPVADPDYRILSTQRPLANSLFHHRPTQTTSPLSKIEAAYRKADRSIDEVIQLLAA